MKKFTIILLALSASFLSAKNIFASEPAFALVINQIRGNECCSIGNIENTLTQIEASIKYSIPSTYALRYDAIMDPEFVKIFKENSRKYPNIIKLGIFLEITPQLAKVSEVTYNGNEKKWFEAQTAYSVGYSFEESVRLTDAIFDKFYQVFGYYPKITSAWMIRTDLLNYINSKYGVAIHQITREQDATDSYTLQGGPPHNPYSPSKEWIMIPDPNSKRNLIIVRQTVSDPLFNYGDSLSAFTSQPNDYARNNKGIGYFIGLTDQAAMNQAGRGFILVGLENSMDKNFQTEYLRQLKHLSKLFRDSKIIFSDSDDFINYWQNRKITTYAGKNILRDTDDFAAWITTPKYRLRIRRVGDNIAITDLRVYNNEYTDPYSSLPAIKEGFWIVPFLINTSSAKPNNAKDPFMEINDSWYISLPKIAKNSSLKLFEKDDRAFVEYTIKNTEKPLRLTFVDEKVETNIDDIDYFNFINIKSLPEYIEYSEVKSEKKLVWNFNKVNALEMKIGCQKQSCEILFESNKDAVNDMRRHQYQYLFPEPAKHLPDKGKTLIYPHNKFAIANRNPVRIVIKPADKFGIPTTLDRELKVETDPEIKYLYNKFDKVYYLDLESDEARKSIVRIALPDILEKQMTIYFAPNCKKELIKCVLNPYYLWMYVMTVIDDKTRPL